MWKNLNIVKDGKKFWLEFWSMNESFFNFKWFFKTI